MIYWLRCMMGHNSLYHLGEWLSQQIPMLYSQLLFPGGNIGKLAVCGTVNDLAMNGAVPQYLSCGLILEEGLPFDELEAILSTMSDMAKLANVQIVTGDTRS